MTCLLACLIVQVAAATLQRYCLPHPARGLDLGLQHLVTGSRRRDDKGLQRLVGGGKGEGEADPADHEAGCAGGGAAGGDVGGVGGDSSGRSGAIRFTLFLSCICRLEFNTTTPITRDAPPPPVLRRSEKLREGTRDAPVGRGVWTRGQQSERRGRRRTCKKNPSSPASSEMLY